MADSRQTLRLDDHWRFHRGDVPAPLANKHLAAYMANKAGWARGAARGNFDDSDWPVVAIPHDWSLDGPFDPANHVNSGFLPRGIGWYRRTFALDEADRGKTLALRFDGIASHATVYLNGHLLARSFNGYLPVDVDFTDVATFGDELNVIAVRVDATPMEGWWYEGAGIYRHVWLKKRSVLHIEEDGIQIDTEESQDAWRVSVRVTTAESPRKVYGTLRIRIFDPEGRLVANRDAGCLSRQPDERRYCSWHSIRVSTPRLWSDTDPILYRVDCEILDGDREHIVLDAASKKFGFRRIVIKGRAGLALNGRPLRFKGTCIHQDHAGVGVAVPASIHRFRVQRLKDMGTNAIRIGHHPPAPEFLDACDELGMLVMNENRSFGSSPEHLKQLRALIRRDASHPSVILWSICNEESIQGTPTARNIATAMVQEVKRVDDGKRPVTAAISGGILNDDAMSETIGVMSINYSFPTLDPFHSKWPDKPVLSSETGCTLSTRGIYKTDASKFQFASYDDDHERWGSSAREAWRQITSRPWMAGLFIWTGFDYRGEPSPHEWPSVTSHWGLLDLCGFEKDAFWRHKAYFTGAPMLHLTPHWNWTVGETIRVQALTNCDAVELFLNGRSLERKTVDPIEMAEWQVPFEPGELRAVGYRAGVGVAAASWQTTGSAVGLGVEIHPSCDAKLLADGETAWPITIFAVDAEGRRVPDANVPMIVSIDGEVILLGVGNGDPNGHFSNRGPAVPLFNGLAQAIVRSTTAAGRVSVRAVSPGLADGVLEFDTIVAAIRPSVPAATRRHLMTDWLMGPITATPPEVTAAAAGTDMNTWERIKAGGPQSAWSTSSGYALYRATLKPPKAMATRAGRLVFSKIDGVAEFFVDGIAQPAGNAIELPPRNTPAEIVVRLRGENVSTGLNGPVELQLSNASS